MRKTTLFATSLSTIILTLASCGQTGPLYMPKDDQASSGSSIMNSDSTIISPGSSIDSGSSVKVDNDPTKPSKNSDPQATELIDTDDGSGYEKDILDSSNGGGTPS